MRFAGFVPLDQVAPAGGQRADGRSVGGRAAYSQFLKLLDKRRLGVAVRSLGETAYGADLPDAQAVALVHRREYAYAILRLLVVGTLHIQFQEAVEEDLGGLQGIFLAPGVQAYPHIGRKHPGFCHLRSDGALPNQIVELLLRRGTLDGGVVNEGRAYGFVCLLRALGPGLELARVMVLGPEIVEYELAGGVDGQRREVGRVGTHVGNQSALVQGLGETHCLAH